MKREFLINIGLLILINLLVKVTYLFLIEVEVQNAVGPEAYGIFLALFNFSYLFQFINDPGLHAYNTTQIGGDIQRLHDQLPQFIGLKILLGGLFLMLVALGGWLIGYVEYLNSGLLLLIAINHILSTFFMFLRSNLSAVGKYRKDSYISALDKLVLMGILGWLLWVTPSETFTIFSFVKAQTVSFLISIAVALLLLRKDIKIWPSFLWTEKGEILRHSLPFALVLLLMSSYNKMDGIMLERLLPEGDYQAGIYAASQRYMEAANMLAYLFATLLLPMFANKLTGNEEVIRLCDTSIRLIAVVVTGICVLGIGYRNQLMGIYEAYDPRYGQLLIFHLLSFACIAISYIYGTLLIARVELKKLNWLFAAGVVLNLTLNLMLIPGNFAVGAVWATFATQLFVMIGQLVIAHRTFHLPVNLPLIVRVVFFVLISILVSYLVQNISGISWLMAVAISGVCILILAGALKIIGKEMIFAFLPLGK